MSETHIQEWLRGAPHDWSLPMLKLVARAESGHTPSRGRPELWVPEQRTVPWFTLADIWQLREGRQKYLDETAENLSPRGIAESGARILPAGTVVLSRTASVGFSGIMPRPMATSQDFVNFVPGPKIISDFLLWVLRGMKPEFERLRRGSTHKTIYMPDALQFRTPLPSLSVQRAIADFLDRKTAAIDALIEKKERLLALLVEKRAALIHRAVTQGLDPTVPMKDSGIPWIGEIPAHWGVLKLGRLLRGIDQGWSPQCEAGHADLGGWGVLKVGCVNYGTWRADEHKALPPELRPRAAAQVRSGDLLMSRANTSTLVGSVARVGSLDRHLMLSDKLYRLRVSTEIDPDYLAMALNSWSVRVQHEVAATGASDSMQNISQGRVRSLLLCLPEIEEQRSITRAVEERLSMTRRVEIRMQTQLEALREYRQALITAAVTGQLAIDEVAA